MYGGTSTSSAVVLWLQAKVFTAGAASRGGGPGGPRREVTLTQRARMPADRHCEYTYRVIYKFV